MRRTIARSDDDHLYALCASCGEGVEISEAFQEGGLCYHKECVKMWRCVNCGAWSEDDLTKCKECQEPKP